jgi:hypothetical protein
MYPAGDQSRSTTSEQETTWWLDDEDEEKPGVTPANDHLAKRPVKTHIYSRKEMEALAEEKLRYVVDIDEKEDFLYGPQIKSFGGGESCRIAGRNLSTLIVRTGHSL